MEEIYPRVEDYNWQVEKKTRKEVHNPWLEYILLDAIKRAETENRYTQIKTIGMVGRGRFLVGKWTTNWSKQQQE